MKPKTIKYYRELIAKKCLNQDFKEVQDYLINPTPSNIRKACMQLFEKRNSKFDFIILDQFFHFENEKNVVREIRKFDIDKFRPIQNFITNKTIKPTTEVLELTAWLIDFQPRPYSEYQKSNKEVIRNGKEKSKSSILIDNNSDGDIKTTKNKYWKYALIFISTAFILFFINQNINFSSKKNEQFKCMVWKETKYIAISCNEILPKKARTKIVPINDELLKMMEKVDLKRSDAIFDEKGNPLYWYGKSKSGVMEFFTTHGFHPINNKHLNPITKGVFDKYIPIHDDIGNSFVNPNTK